MRLLCSQVPQELDVFKSAVRWIEAQPEDRLPLLTHLLSKLNPDLAVITKSSKALEAYDLTRQAMCMSYRETRGSDNWHSGLWPWYPRKTWPSFSRSGKFKPGSQEKSSNACNHLADEGVRMELLQRSELMEIDANPLVKALAFCDHNSALQSVPWIVSSHAWHCTSAAAIFAFASDMQIKQFELKQRKNYRCSAIRKLLLQLQELTCELAMDYMWLLLKEKGVPGANQRNWCQLLRSQASVLHWLHARILSTWIH